MRTKRSGQSHTYIYMSILSYSIFEDYLLAILVISVAARLGFRVFQYLLFLAEVNPTRVCKSTVIS